MRSWNSYHLTTPPTQLVGKQEIVQFFSGFGDFLTLDEVRLEGLLESGQSSYRNRRIGFDSVLGKGLSAVIDSPAQPSHTSPKPADKVEIEPR